MTELATLLSPSTKSNLGVDKSGAVSIPGSARAPEGRRLDLLAAKVTLGQAARDGHVQLVEFHINALQTQTQTQPLHMRFKTKKALLTALLDELNEDDFAPIHQAARYNRVEVLKLLLEAGASPNLPGGESNMTPLHFAARNGHVAATEVLLARNEVKPNATDAFNYTPLHWACAKGHAQIVDILIKNNRVEKNLEDNEKATPILVAATYGFDNILKLLLPVCDYMAVDINRNNILHCCTDSPKAYVIAQLILDNKSIPQDKRNSLLSQRNSDENTPLHLSVAANLIALAKLLLSHGAAVDAVGKDSKTPLHFACLLGNRRMVELLIKKGASVTETDEMQTTPLHIACQFAKTFDVVKYLVDVHNADISAKDADNFTPLMFAAWKGQTRTVSYLLQKGADADLKDANEKTALLYACEANKVETVKLLLSIHPRAPSFEGPISNNNNAPVRTATPQDAPPLSPSVSLAVPSNISVQTIVTQAMDSDNLPNVFSVSVANNETVFTYDRTESGTAVNENENSSSRFTCSVPLSEAVVAQQTAQQTKKASKRSAGKRFNVSFVFEPTVQWGVSWMGRFVIYFPSGSKTIYVPGVSTYDVAGLTGDRLCSERIGDKFYEFQLTLTIALINALRRGASEPEITKIHQATEDLVNRYHGRVTMWKWMFHQVVTAFFGASDPKPYPDFVLDEEKLEAISLDIPEREHSRYFLKLWKQRQARDAGDDSLQPPPGFFKLCKKMKDPCPNVNIAESHDNTALHIAAEKGFKTIVQLLLGRGASLTLTNDSDQTPLHLSAKTGHVDVSREIIKWTSSGASRASGYESGATSADEAEAQNILEAEDDNSRTPLHYAARHAHRKSVMMLLEEGANIDAKDVMQWTPLHWACHVGSLAVVKTLVESDADIEATDKEGKTALHIAAMMNRLEVVQFLVDQGVDISLATKQKGLTALDLAVENNAFDVAKYFCGLDDDSFFEVMLSDKSKDPITPLGRMIAKMPHAAVLALSRCVQVKGTAGTADHSITYRFDLIDKDIPPNKDPNDNTCLELMVKLQREDVMNHPVTRKLLDFKWAHFGAVIFYFNLSVYMLFVATLTLFVVVTPVPSFVRGSFAPRSEVDGSKGLAYFCHVVASILAAFRLLQESSQMWIVGRLYFLELVNYFEVFVYVSTLAIMCPDLGHASRDKKEWQWDMMVFTIFFTWIDLVVFIRRIPGIGLYVLMFQDVILTFARAAMVFALFLIAFSLSFFVLLQNTNPNFRNIGDALLKTLVMLMGEFEYEGIFNVNDAFNSLLPDTCADSITCSERPALPSPNITKILFAAFVLLMPLLLLNLLVGLAVGDIQQVREKAELMRLSMQTHLITNIERKMGDGTVRKFVQAWVKEITVYPDRKTGFFRDLIKQWQSSKANDAAMELAQGNIKSEREEVLEKVEGLKDDIGRVKNILKAIDQSRQQQEEFAKLLSQKLDLDVQTETS